MRGLAPLVAVALAAAGCGGAARQPSPPPSPSAATRFAEACGACHTLAAAGTHGTAATNLDEARPSAAAVLRAIATGPGAMPARLLTGRAAAEVARFVARTAR